MSSYLDLERLVTLANEREPSDIFLKVDQPPFVKIKGKILSSGLPKLTRNNILLLLYEIELVSPPAIEAIKEKRLNFDRKHHELDIIYRLNRKDQKKYTKIASLRINAFWQQENPGMVIRVVDRKKPVIGLLSFPPKLKKMLKDISGSSSGLILVTGPTGSGKSSTLSAMINHLSNSPASCHILTIEDPIERIYEDKIEGGEVRAIITSRELEVDTPTMESALRGALRQAPDAILIGEIRDRESMAIALEAAQTGHLVFSTLHTMGAIETINRITALLDPEPEINTRRKLADVLRCIISQQLVRRAYTEAERLAAVEILIGTDVIRKILKKKEWRDEEIKDEMEEDQQMQTLQTHLSWLVQCDLVEKKDAIQVGYVPPST